MGLKNEFIYVENTKLTKPPKDKSLGLKRKGFDKAYFIHNSDIFIRKEILFKGRRRGVIFYPPKPYHRQIWM